MALSPKEAAQARKSIVNAKLHALEDHIDAQLSQRDLAPGIAVNIRVSEQIFTGILTWPETFKWIKTTYEAAGWEVSDALAGHVSFRNPAKPPTYNVGTGQLDRPIDRRA